MALLEGNLAVQFKTLTQYLAVDCHASGKYNHFWRMPSKPCNASRLFIPRAGCAAVDKNGLSAVTGRMPHSHFRKCTIILGRPTPSRQQMPVFGDICYITLSRQSWLQGRFPCHVGPLAELCWNLEASHLQNTLTTVWGHLLVTSMFRVGSWTLYTFSSRVLELGLRAQVRPTSQQGQPGSRAWFNC